MKNRFLEKAMTKNEIRVFNHVVFNNFLDISELRAEFKESLENLEKKGILIKKNNFYFLDNPSKVFKNLNKILKNSSIDKIIDEKTTHQHIEVTKMGDEFLLELNSNPQVCSIDEEEYHFCIGTVPCCLAKKLNRVLILGGGDLLAARNVLQFNEVDEVILVELDKRILDIFCNLNFLADCNKFAFSDSRLKIINGDAFKWLNEDSGNFDVIIYDCEETFTNQGEEFNMVSYLGFYELMFNKLSEGGILTFNCSNDPEEEEYFDYMFEKNIKKNLPTHISNIIEKKKKMHQKQWLLHKFNHKNVVRIDLTSPVVGFHSNWYFSNEKITQRRGNQSLDNFFIR
ncbi:MAG: hypothetical protein ACQESF_00120 [Nanobdellota archaeon]